MLFPKSTVLISIVLVGIFFALLGYDIYFVPTSLTVCVAESERSDGVRAVVIGLVPRTQRWDFAPSKYVDDVSSRIRAVPDNSGMANFKNIKKGWWKVYYEKVSGELVEQGGGRFDGIEAFVGCQ